MNSSFYTGDARIKFSEIWKFKKDKIKYALLLYILIHQEGIDWSSKQWKTKDKANIEKVLSELIQDKIVILEG